MNLHIYPLVIIAGFLLIWILNVILIWFNFFELSSKILSSLLKIIRNIKDQVSNIKFSKNIKNNLIIIACLVAFIVLLGGQIYIHPNAVLQQLITVILYGGLVIVLGLLVVGFVELLYMQKEELVYYVVIFILFFADNLHLSLFCAIGRD